MKTNLYTYAMQYGLYVGIAMALNFILSMSQNGVLSALSWAVWLIIMLMLYYSTVRYRKQACEDALTYGQAFTFILLMYLFGAVVAVAIRIIYLKWINPDALTSLYDSTMLAIEQVNMPNKAEVRDALTTYMQPVKFSFLYLWIDIFSAFFYALIIAAFARKQKVVEQ